MELWEFRIHPWLSRRELGRQKSMNLLHLNCFRSYLTVPNSQLTVYKKELTLYKFDLIDEKQKQEWKFLLLVFRVGFKEEAGFRQEVDTGM